MPLHELTRNGFTPIQMMPVPSPASCALCPQLRSHGFCGSCHPWTTGPVGGGAVLPCAPRLEAAGLVRGRRTVQWPQLRTARFQQNGPCMHRCRIQLGRACAIDASRAELSIGPWVGGVSVVACPSFSRVKSAGQLAPTEIGRLHSTKITPR